MLTTTFCANISELRGGGTPKLSTLKRQCSMLKVYQLKVQGKHPYFSRLFAEAKWWYNFAVDDLRLVDTKQKIVAVKRGDVFEHETLRLLSSQMRQKIIQKMWDNIKGLSTRKAQGAKVGKLKHKSFINAIPLSNQTFKLDGKLKLQGCGKRFSLRGWKQLPENPDIRSGELLRKPSGIYLSVTVKLPDEEKPAPTLSVGLDMGISKALNFHDGTVIQYKADVKLAKKMRLAKKRISRRQKGSKNRNKARALYRRLEEKLSAQKTDAVNKVYSKLKPYQVFMQDELLSSWKRQFGKQMQRNIHGGLKAKLNTNSATVMLKRSAPTTQYCPSCHALNKHKLSERIYRCPCGYTMSRDKHAANNMVILSSDETYVKRGRTDGSIHENQPVELVSDLFSILADIEHKQLTVKQESPGFSHGE